MFKVGDKVSGMYDAGKRGTVLDPRGEVVGVASDSRDGFKVTVRFPGDRTVNYHTSPTGACDYLMRNPHGGDSSDMGGAKPTTP